MIAKFILRGFNTKKEYKMEISFTSTYRIPITQAGVNNAKKIKLRELIESYPNSLIGKSKQGYARVSMADSEDENFIRKLKGIGYKIYQKFDGENIEPENLDVFIKEKINARDFNQKGKNPPPMSREMKEQRRFERKYTEPAKTEESEDIIDEIISEETPTIKKSTLSSSETPKTKPTNEEIHQEKIRQSEQYLRMKEEFGEEFAEAVYFDKK